jgi:hypothetical protein
VNSFEKIHDIRNVINFITDVHLFFFLFYTKHIFQYLLFLIHQLSLTEEITEVNVIKYMYKFH